MDDVNQKWCNNCKRKACVLAKGKLKMCTERTHIGHVQIDRIALSDLSESPTRIQNQTISRGFEKVAKPNQKRSTQSAKCSLSYVENVQRISDAR